MRAKKDVIVDGNVDIGGKLKVSGKSTFKNDIIIKKSILFDDANEFAYIPATSTSRPVFFIGKNTAKVLPYYECPTAQANTDPLFIHVGAVISRMPAGSGVGLTDASISMQVASWNGNGLIEVSGVAADGTGTNGLEINSFCKRNTYINCGWDLNPNNFVNGGRVYMGAEVQMQSALRIGYNASTTFDALTAIEINQNTTNGNAIKFNTYNNALKVLTINNPNFAKSPFVVYGSGKTQIGSETVSSRPNSLLTVSGEIDCKSLYVLKPTNWQDKVFAPDYKLQKLSEVEKYIDANKHLPGIKSEKEILENGYDVNETDAVLLEKIENLYLYIIQQQKEIEELKKKVK
jgi:hypothetical protein